MVIINHRLMSNQLNFSHMLQNSIDWQNSKQETGDQLPNASCRMLKRKIGPDGIWTRGLRISAAPSILRPAYRSFGLWVWCSVQNSKHITALGCRRLITGNCKSPTLYHFRSFRHPTLRIQNSRTKTLDWKLETGYWKLKLSYGPVKLSLFQFLLKVTT